MVHLTAKLHRNRITKCGKARARSVDFLGECYSHKDFGFGNTLAKLRVAFTEVSVEETEGSHISSDRQWKKLVSKLLAHEILGTLFYAVKKLEVRLRGSSPESTTIGLLHQWADDCLVKVKDAPWR